MDIRSYQARANAASVGAFQLSASTSENMTRNSPSQGLTSSMPGNMSVTPQYSNNAVPGYRHAVPLTQNQMQQMVLPPGQQFAYDMQNKAYHPIDNQRNSFPSHMSPYTYDYRPNDNSTSQTPPYVSNHPPAPMYSSPRGQVKGNSNRPPNFYPTTLPNGIDHRTAVAIPHKNDPKSSDSSETNNSQESSMETPESEGFSNGKELSNNVSLTPGKTATPPPNNVNSGYQADNSANSLLPHSNASSQETQNTQSNDPFAPSNRIMLPQQTPVENAYTINQNDSNIYSVGNVPRNISPLVTNGIRQPNYQTPRSYTPNRSGPPNKVPDYTYRMPASATYVPNQNATAIGRHGNMNNGNGAYRKSMGPPPSPSPVYQVRNPNMPTPSVYGGYPQQLISGGGNKTGMVAVSNNSNGNQPNMAMTSGNMLASQQTQQQQQHSVVHNNISTSPTPTLNKLLTNTYPNQPHSAPENANGRLMSSPSSSSNLPSDNGVSTVYSNANNIYGGGSYLSPPTAPSSFPESLNSGKLNYENNDAQMNGHMPNSGIEMGSSNSSHMNNGMPSPSPSAASASSFQEDESNSSTAGGGRPNALMSPQVANTMTMHNHNTAAQIMSSSGTMLGDGSMRSSMFPPSMPPSHSNMSPNLYNGGANMAMCGGVPPQGAMMSMSHNYQQNMPPNPTMVVPPPHSSGAPSSASSGSVSGSSTTGGASTGGGGSSSNSKDDERLDHFLYSLPFASEPGRKEFSDRLMKILEAKSLVQSKVPCVAKQPIDLFRLYKLVKEKGGFTQVCNQKLWKDIANVMELNNSPMASYNMKKHYTKFLLPFECQYDLNGADSNAILAEIDATQRKRPARAKPPKGEGKRASKGAAAAAAAAAAANLQLNNTMGGHPPDVASSHTINVCDPFSDEFANNQRPNSSTPSKAPAPNMTAVSASMAPPPGGYYSKQPFKSPYDTYKSGWPVEPTDSSMSSATQPSNFCPSTVTSTVGGTPVFRSGYQHSTVAIPVSVPPTSNVVSPYGTHPSPQLVVVPSTAASSCSTSPVSVMSASNAPPYSSQLPFQTSPSLPPPHLSQSQPPPSTAVVSARVPMQHSSIPDSNSTYTPPQRVTASNSSLMQSQPPQTKSGKSSSSVFGITEAEISYPQHCDVNQKSVTENAKSLGNTSLNSLLNNSANSANKMPTNTTITTTANKDESENPIELLQKRSKFQLESATEDTLTHWRDSVEHVEFAPSSVEASEIVFKPIMRVPAIYINDGDTKKMMMCLKSGLQTEISWALETLTVVLFDDVTVHHVNLDKLSGILDILLVLLKKNLDKLIGRHFKKDESQEAVSVHVSQSRSKVDVDSTLKPSKQEKNGMTNPLKSLEGDNIESTPSRKRKFEEPSNNAGSPEKNKHGDASMEFECASAKKFSTEELDDAEGSLNTLRRLKAMSLTKADIDASSYNCLHREVLDSLKMQRMRTNGTRHFHAVPKPTHTNTHFLAPSNEEQVCSESFESAKCEQLLQSIDTQSLTCAQTALSITNILRSFSCLVINEDKLSQHSELLKTCSKLIQLAHVHPSKKNFKDQKSHGSKGPSPPLFSLDDWESTYLHGIRENCIVLLSNIAARINLDDFDENCVFSLMDSLLHWLVCKSCVSLDPVPGAIHSTITMQRLALESLCKMCLAHNNTDYLLATPPSSRISQLFTVLLEMITDANKPAIRELALVLLNYLSKSDVGVSCICSARHFVSRIISYLEESIDVVSKADTYRSYPLPYSSISRSSTSCYSNYNMYDTAAASLFIARSCSNLLLRVTKMNPESILPFHHRILQLSCYELFAASAPTGSSSVDDNVTEVSTLLSDILFLLNS